MGFAVSMVMAVTAIVACLAAQTQTTALEAEAIAASLQQAQAGLAGAVAAIVPDQLHLPKPEQKAVAESQDSITRNLREAVPGLLAEFQAAPENLGASFRLYRDLEAVLLVAQRSADTLPADDDAASSLQASTRQLRAGLEQLGNWIESRGTADYIRRQQARTGAPAARPVQPSPPTLIINDANTPATKTKKSH